MPYGIENIKPIGVYFKNSRKRSKLEKMSESLIVYEIKKMRKDRFF